MGNKDKHGSGKHSSSKHSSSKHSSSKHGSSKHGSSKHNPSKHASSSDGYTIYKGVAWGWDEENEQWYRHYEDAEGGISRTYPAASRDNEETYVSTAYSEPEVPRGVSESATIGDLTQGVHGLRLSESPNESQHGYNYVLSQGKGKGNASDSRSYEPHPPGDEEEHIHNDDDDDDEEEYNDDGDDRAATVTGRTYFQPGAYSAAPDSPADYNNWVQKSMDNYTTDVPGVYESNTGIPLASNMSHTYGSHSPGPSHYYEGATAESSQIASESQGAPDFSTEDISSNYGQPGGQEHPKIKEYYQHANVQFRDEILRGDYGIWQSQHFVPGSILKLPWSEPKGHKTMGPISEGCSVNLTGESVYQGIRRFIVIGSAEGHSHCIPILTYEGRACTKRGVKARRHGIIYDQLKNPCVLKNEPELGFDPVRAVMTRQEETLAGQSRINYSKASSVEHNVPVMFIGRIHPHDFQAVLDAHNQCYEDMNFNPVGGSSNRRRRRK